MRLLMLVAVAAADPRQENNVVTVSLGVGESLVAARRGLMACRPAEEGKPLRPVADGALDAAMGGGGVAALWRRITRRWPRAEVVRFEAACDLEVDVAPSRSGWGTRVVTLDADRVVYLRRAALLAAAGNVALSDAGDDGVRCRGVGSVVLQAPGTLEQRSARIDVQAGRAAAWSLPAEGRPRRPPTISYAGARWRSFDADADVFVATSIDEPKVVVVQKRSGPEPLRPGSGLLKSARRLAAKSAAGFALSILTLLLVAFAQAGFSLARTPATAAHLATTVADVLQKLMRAFQAATRELSPA